MDRLALTGFTTGFALTIMGAIGILASELVGTAHASRGGAGEYLLAISSGAAQRIAPSETADRSSAPAAVGGLECRRNLDLGFLSIGVYCRRG